MPAVESDIIRRADSTSPFTERQNLRWRINRVGGRVIGEQTVEGKEKTRFTEEVVERLLNGRSETINIVGKKGVIYWGNDARRSWIGVKAGKERISFVLEVGENPRGYYSVQGKPEENWAAKQEEIIAVVEYRDELLGIK